MSVIVAGSSEPAGALTAALLERGIEAELHALAGAANGTSVQGLAEGLVALERRIAAGSESAAMVAIGAGDAGMAAALTATKAGVALLACLPAEPGLEQDDATRAIAELSELRLPIPADGPGVAGVADDIVAWLGAAGGRAPLGDGAL